MKYNVTCEMYCSVVTHGVELPEGKTWDDVDEYYVKWNTLFIEWLDHSRFEVDLDDGGDGDPIDWKRPTHIEITDEKWNQISDRRVL